MSFEPSLPNSSPINRQAVMQGQVRVSKNENDEFTTVLGSCVAACMYDPVVHVGGMNHFLLVEPKTANHGEVIDEHYGSYLMELLINEMLALGARKDRIKAQLYGGANMFSGLAQFGSANADFAQEFLRQENIPLVRSDLRGTCARRVDFRPARGLVRNRSIEAPQNLEKATPVRRSSSSGVVELF